MIIRALLKFGNSYAIALYYYIGGFSLNLRFFHTKHIRLALIIHRTYTLAAWAHSLLLDAKEQGQEKSIRSTATISHQPSVNSVHKKHGDYF